ncbi:MAG TPA: iron ABC transporter permease [Candidatus Ozemobacteraceae bacterium]|mgnify:CR=1 FL=1|nr:iron ABC transporter permease [Candidatus Ozemobacteraceae bacterium]
MNGRIILPCLAIAAVVTMLIGPFIGGVPVAFDALLRPGAPDAGAVLLWKLRMPRILTAFFAGAALSVAGAAFQAMFRNPLATPFTLGVSGAASLGAALYMRWGADTGTAGPGGILASFAGAAACVAAVYGLAWGRGGVSNARLLLAGVAISFCCSSLIMFSHYASTATDAFRMMRHLMGSLSSSGWETVAILLPVTLLGGLLLWALAWELDLLAVGEDIAQSRGVPVERIRHAIFLVTCALEAFVVALCGPIGFVGLMIPHCCRLWFGGGHRTLLPASLLLGGIFLSTCDTVARTVVAPSEMPVGVLTSLIGGVFFLWLLFGASSTNTSLE